MKFLDVPQSGSTAGQTHSKNRAGQYIRSRRAPVQPPGTGRRATIRAAFGAASQGYGNLTAAQQMAWQSYADSYPYTDALGQSIKLTGHQMFVAIGTNRLNVGLDLPTNPPTSNEVTPITGLDATFSLATGAELVFDATASGEKTTISFSPPLSPGRLFNKTYWQFSVVNGPGTGESCATTFYAAEFGSPAVGQRVFAKVQNINAEGVAGVPVTIMMTVVA